MMLTFFGLRGREMIFLCPFVLILSFVHFFLLLQKKERNPPVGMAGKRKLLRRYFLCFWWDGISSDRILITLQFN